MINSYKDLIVWKKAIELTREIYSITEQFPKEEIFDLTSQIRRCSISIPSNIVGSRSRGTRKDLVQFLRIALGSASELQTQLEIVKILPKTRTLAVKKCEELLI